MVFLVFCILVFETILLIHKLFKFQFPKWACSTTGF